MAQIILEYEMANEDSVRKTLSVLGQLENTEGVDIKVKKEGDYLVCSVRVFSPIKIKPKKQ